MGTTANKLTYLKETVKQIVNKTNDIDGTITDNTTFREASQKVVDVYNHYNNDTQIITPNTTTGKADYLKETKRLYKEAINLFNEGITDNTTFRQYVNKLDDIYNNLPKVTGEGTEVTLENAKSGKMQIQPKGNTIQNDGASPNNPQEIKNVTGNNTVIITGQDQNSNIQPIEKELNLSSKNKYYTKENGYISNKNGSITTTAGDVAISSDFIKIQKNASFIYYYGENLSSNINNIYANRVAFYDKDKNWITGKNIQSISEISKIAIESEAVYIKASFSSAVENPMIAFEETEYELYYNYTLMKDDYITEDCVIHHKRGKIVFDGDENWEYYISLNRFAIAVNNLKKFNQSVVPSILCNKLKAVRKDKQDETNNNISVAQDEMKIIIRIDNTITNATEFKTWLQNNPIIVEYELAEETTETIPNTIPLYNQIKDLYRTIIPEGTIVIETESEEENAQLIVNAKALAKVGDNNG